MELKQITDFIDWELERLNKLYDGNSDKEKMVFVQCTKLMEEVGEFSAEILCQKGYQRKHKTTDMDKISNEFADVIFVAMLVAKRLGIDIEKSFKDKMKIVSERKY